MDFSQLKAHLSSVGALAPAYVVYGKDAFLRQSALAMFRAKIQNPAFNYAAFDDGDASIAKNLSLLPWGDVFRLVVVSNIKKNSVSAYTSYLASPNTACVLVLVFDGDAPAAILKTATPIECSRLDGKFISTYLGKKGDASGIVFSPLAIMRLVEYTGGDMAVVETESDKLIAFAGDGTVTEDMVRDLVEPFTEYKIYELGDCLGRQNYSAALKILDGLIDGRTEPMVILRALTKHFRRLLHSSLHPNEDISAKLDVKPFAASKLKEQAKRFSQVRLKLITDILYSCEFDIKSGKSEASEAVNSAVYRVVHTAGGFR